LIACASFSLPYSPCCSPLALDPQTKAEIDELITYVQMFGVRFIRNGSEYSGAEDAKRRELPLAPSEPGLSLSSLQNYRDHLERSADPMLNLVELLLASDPARLAQFRAEYDALIALYFEDNVVRQDYLLTRAVTV
jgi:hypothetical protein